MPDSCEFFIDGMRIGRDSPPFIIAELSANHLQSIDRALSTVTAAKEAGVNAIKLQTYTADTLTIDCQLPDFLLREGPWKGQTLYQLYKQAYTPWEWHERLFEHARRLGLIVFSTPFDSTSVELLEALKTPAYKVASFELVDLPLIRLIASTGKPIILSTGLASLGEISEAVAAAREAGCRQLSLLHCVSGYPTPPEEFNLAVIEDLSNKFSVVAGLSDHSLGSAASIAAIALGAAIIEKHFTLDRRDGGPDSTFSLEPREMADLVNGCRTAWLAIGKTDYSSTLSEQPNLVFRRSLYAVRDILEGELLTRLNIRSIRPGYGLPPKYFDAVLGQRAKRYIARGSALTWDLIQ